MLKTVDAIPEACLLCKREMLEFVPTTDKRYALICLKSRCPAAKRLDKVIISPDAKDALTAQNMASGRVYDD